MRKCPQCHDEDVHRSHRRGVLEWLLLPLVLLRPFRCHTCRERFYGFFFLR